MKVGDLLGVGGGGEAFVGIGRQLVGQREIDAEEIVQGIFVFGGCETAGMNPSGLGEVASVCFDERVFQAYEKV